MVRHADGYPGGSRRPAVEDLSQTFFSATLLDPDAGRYLTKTYYCANRPFGAQRYDKTTKKTYYVGMAFNMTER